MSHEEATARVRILKSFLDVRQTAAEEVVEESTEALIKVKTHHQFTADGTLLCEDVFVESRPHVK